MLLQGGGVSEFAVSVFDDEYSKVTPDQKKENPTNVKLQLALRATNKTKVDIRTHKDKFNKWDEENRNMLLQQE